VRTGGKSGSAWRADRRKMVEKNRMEKARMCWTLEGTSYMLEI